ncbi:hypothetical protein BV898_16125 [Hypsibius exemplaris]|uniref:J domain-containing protein n=1 Tax=Hypsibius exemplaris TaxID=2072580 RepID=A0A9X6RLD7_HYPEX|nr:hypothetical protein BV898_16125 [Hypsibius exemplaris]
MRTVSSTVKRSYYDVLGISRTATSQEIKSAYYELSKKFHPDLNDGPASKSKFQEITEAYETLGNTISRRTYDQSSPQDYGSSGPYSRAQRNPYRETDFPGGPENGFGAWNRQAPGSFSGKHRKPQQKGKTDYWDYDEYYRQHYSDMRQQQHNEKRWKDFQEEMQKTDNFGPFQGRRPNYTNGRNTGVGRLINIAVSLFFIWFLLELMAVVTKGSPDRRQAVRSAPYSNRREKEEAELRERLRRRVNSKLSTIYPPDDVELPPIDYGLEGNGSDDPRSGNGPGMQK